MHAARAASRAAVPGAAGLCHPRTTSADSAGGGQRDHRRPAAALGEAVAARPGPRFYHWRLPNELMRRWAEQLARLRPDTAHLALEAAGLGTPPERITDVLDTADQLATRRAAIAAHASQTSPYEGPPDQLAEAFCPATT